MTGPVMSESERPSPVFWLIDRFIPTDMLPYDHPEILYKARVLVGVTLLSGLYHAPSTVHIFQSRGQLAHLEILPWLSMLAVLMLLVAPWIFRRTGSFGLTANLYGFAATLAMISLVAISGGYGASPALPQWPLVVIFSFIMAGWRTACFWGLMAMALWLATAGFDNSLFINVLPAETMQIVSTGSILLAGISLLGVLWFFEFYQRQLLGRLQVERDKALYAAAHDPLTGLCNRKTFEHRLLYLLERRSVIPGVDGLLIIDLDGFKPINDNLGHKAGDQLLTAIAGRLQGSTRRSDLAARFGGDEFAVLVTGLCDQGDIKPVVEKIHHAITSAVSLDDSTQVTVGASIGIAFLPRDGEDLETLLHNADQAMYRAKVDRQPYCFYQDLPQPA